MKRRKVIDTNIKAGDVIGFSFFWSSNLKKAIMAE
jgi:hypothetical protein